MRDAKPPGSHCSGRRERRRRRTHARGSEPSCCSEGVRRGRSAAHRPVCRRGPPAGAPASAPSGRATPGTLPHQGFHSGCPRSWPACGFVFACRSATGSASGWVGRSGPRTGDAPNRPSCSRRPKNSRPENMRTPRGRPPPSPHHRRTRRSTAAPPPGWDPGRPSSPDVDRQAHQGARLRVGLSPSLQWWFARTGRSPTRAAAPRHQRRYAEGRAGGRLRDATPVPAPC